MRHVLETLRFRWQHVLEELPEDFATFDAGQGVRTPQAVALHVLQLLRFARSSFVELKELEPNHADHWLKTLAAIAETMDALADDLQQARPVLAGKPSLEQMLQGPLLDMATHIGQLAMLRRLAGYAPVARLSYWQIDLPYT